MLISLKICLITEKKCYVCMHLQASAVLCYSCLCVRRDANITNDDVIQIVGDSLTSRASIPIT